MEVIPAIDIIDGKCVRLKQGEFTSYKRYEKDPLSLAKEFEQAGFKRLHLVDLIGAKKGEIKSFPLLRVISKETNLKVDFSGGIRSEDDLRRSFDYGASQVCVGSLSVTEPLTVAGWLGKYGCEKIVIAIDLKDNEAAISGWSIASKLSFQQVLEPFLGTGLKYVLCTDIKRDGTLTQPNFELYEELVSNHPNISIVASGGVRSLAQLRELEKTGVWGVVVGKALLEGFIHASDLKGSYVG